MAKRRPLHGEFLADLLFASNKAQTQNILADDIGINRGTLSKILSGSLPYEDYEPRLWKFTFVGEKTQDGLTEHQIAVRHSMRYLAHLHKQEGVRIAPGMPALAKKFLAKKLLIDQDGKATQLLIDLKANSTPAEEGKLSRRDSIIGRQAASKLYDSSDRSIDPAVVSYKASSPLVDLRSPRFAQVPNPAIEFELIFDLICDHIVGQIDEVDTIFGVKEVRCEISVEGCEIKKKYFDELCIGGVAAVRSEEGWRFHGPIDRFGFLCDQLIKHPICYGHKEVETARMVIRVFTRRAYLSIEQPHRRGISSEEEIIMKRMMMIYLMDKYYPDDPNIELCKVCLEW